MLCHVILWPAYKEMFSNMYVYKCSYEHKHRTNWNKNAFICISVCGPSQKWTWRNKCTCTDAPQYFTLPAQLAYFLPAYHSLWSLAVWPRATFISHKQAEKYLLVPANTLWYGGRFFIFFNFLTTRNKLNINLCSVYSVMQKIYISFYTTDKFCLSFLAIVYCKYCVF